jgi:transposase
LPTIEKFFRFLRQLIYGKAIKELEELKLAGSIEMDEALFGGKRHGKRGWGAAGKEMVFGIYQRNGKVITFPVTSREAPTLIPLIAKSTQPGSLYYTDEWRAYASLAISGNHVIVSKEKGKPKAKGKNHLNGIEGFWSYAKHWLYQYRGVSKRYFHLYLKEIEWRFNNRNQNLIPLLKQLIKDQIGADN